MAHSIHHVTRRIADADLPKVRDIETGDERPATDHELLQLGIIPTPLAGVYDCVEQYRRDDTVDGADFEPFGHVPVGELLSSGVDRFQQLPPDVKPHVLQSRVLRSAEPGGALAVATASLEAQTAAIAKNVGDGVSIDVGTTEDEAARLAMAPDTLVDFATVPMSQVVDGEDVVQQDQLEPHRWAGERRPPAQRRIP